MSWELPIYKQKTIAKFNPAVYGIDDMNPFNFVDSGKISKVANKEMKIISQNALQPSPMYVVRSEVGMKPSMSFNDRTKENYSIDRPQKKITKFFS